MTYRRGIQAVERDADALAKRAVVRVERQALRDQIASLLGRNARLERELKRARRALAAERTARDLRRLEHERETSRANVAIEILCKKSFPEDACRT
jgi:hypothetical protein